MNDALIIAAFVDRKRPPRLNEAAIVFSTAGAGKGHDDPFIDPIKLDIAPRDTTHDTVGDQSPPR